VNNDEFFNMVVKAHAYFEMVKGVLSLHKACCDPPSDACVCIECNKDWYCPTVEQIRMKMTEEQR